MTPYAENKSATILFADGQAIYDAFKHIEHLLIFDPPWNILQRFSMKNSTNILAFCDGHRAGDIIEMFGAPTWDRFAKPAHPDQGECGMHDSVVRVRSCGIQKWNALCSSPSMQVRL